MNEYSQKYTYAVFKYHVYDDSYFMLPVSELPPTGFSSLYFVTDETARILETTGIAGYKGTVWSPQLVMDFDDNESAKQAEVKLSGMGLSYTVFTTGNRGSHIYVDRPHAPSHLLPKIDREWVKENFPQADMSIYSSLHLFRNVGTIHKSTGKRKAMLRLVTAQPLILPDTVEERQVSTNIQAEKPSESIFLNNYIMGLSTPQWNGHRHETLMKLGLTLKGLGEPIEFIERWLHHVNCLFEQPKSNEEIERLVQFVQDATIEV